MPPESYADDSVDWDAVAAEVEEAETAATQQVSDIVTLEGASRRTTSTVHLTAGTVFTTSDPLGDEVSADDYDRLLAEKGIFFVHLQLH